MKVFISHSEEDSRIAARLGACIRFNGQLGLEPYTFCGQPNEDSEHFDEVIVRNLLTSCCVIAVAGKRTNVPTSILWHLELPLARLFSIPIFLIDDIPPGERATPELELIESNIKARAQRWRGLNLEDLLKLRGEAEISEYEVDAILTPLVEALAAVKCPSDSGSPESHGSGKTGSRREIIESDMEVLEASSAWITRAKNFESGLPAWAKVWAECMERFGSAFHDLAEGSERLDSNFLTESSSSSGIQSGALIGSSLFCGPDGNVLALSPSQGGFEVREVLGNGGGSRATMVLDGGADGPDHPSSIAVDLFGEMCVAAWTHEGSIHLRACSTAQIVTTHSDGRTGSWVSATIESKARQFLEIELRELSAANPQVIRGRMDARCRPALEPKKSKKSKKSKEEQGGTSPRPNDPVDVVIEFTWMPSTGHFEFSLAAPGSGRAPARSIDPDLDVRGLVPPELSEAVAEDVFPVADPLQNGRATSSRDLYRYVVVRSESGYQLCEVPASRPAGGPDKS